MEKPCKWKYETVVFLICPFISPHQARRNIVFRLEEPSKKAERGRGGGEREGGDNTFEAV